MMMKKVFRFLIIAMALVAASEVTAQNHVREVAKKIREITDTKVPMTNVVRRNPSTRAVELTVIEASNLPPKITKELVRAMERDESAASVSQKSVSGLKCTRLMKFVGKDSVLSVVISYRPSSYASGSVVIREDFIGKSGRRRVSYEMSSPAETEILEWVLFHC